MAEHTLELDYALSMAEGDALRDQLIPLLQHTHVVLDASQVEMIDTCAMQVLVAFVLEHRAKGGSSRVVPGDGFSQVAHSLGVFDLLTEARA